MASIVQRPNKRMKTGEGFLKKREILSATVYYIVDDIEGSSLKVHDLSHGHGNLPNNSLNYGKSVAERESYTASQFEREEKCCRTKIVEALSNAGDSVFTVEFKTSKNEHRILRGRKLGLPDTIYGRTEVIDFDVDTFSHNVKDEDGNIVHKRGDTFPSSITQEEKEKHQRRQVDHRTITSLILKNVKYVKK